MTDDTPQHPAFPQPADSLVPLWKYGEFWKFEKFLKTGKLYMARADLVASEYDFFEGTTPAGELLRWEEQAAAANTDAKRQQILEERAFLSKVTEHYQTQYYIMSWCSGVHEAADMWERYGKVGAATTGPGAVAIVVDYQTLKAALPLEYMDIGLVRYIDDTQGLRTGNLVEAITHKRIYFRNEQEVRVVATRPPAPAQPWRGDFDKDLTDKDGVPEGAYVPLVSPRSLIQRVVLQPNATPELVEAVKHLCEDHGVVPPEPSAMDRRARF
jgi:hypothetical protein